MELLEAQAEHFRRPFGAWHYRSFFRILYQAQDFLRGHGITRGMIRAELSVVERMGAVSFQKIAEQRIRHLCSEPYNKELRCRHKLARWNSDVLPGHIGRRVWTNFSSLKLHVSPRALFCVFPNTMEWVGDKQTYAISMGGGRCKLQTLLVGMRRGG